MESQTKQHLRTKLALALCITATLAANAPVFTRLAAAESADDLLQRLSSDDDEVILEALLFEVETPKPLENQEILARITSLTDSDNETIRRSACECLAIGGRLAKSAERSLRDHLDDPVPAVRIAAANALWKVGGDSKAAAITLSDVLVSESEKDRQSAAYTLESMGSEAAVALPALLRCAVDSRDDVRAHAVSILGHIGPEQSGSTAAVLERALSDESHPVRIDAATALFQVDRPSEQTVRVLMAIASEGPELLDADRDWGGSSDAASAVQALKRIGPDAAAATPTLINALKSRFLWIRLVAAEALGEIGPSASAAVPALSKALRETETHAVPFVHHAYCVGENAADALAKIGPASCDVLLDALNDRDVSVRAHAARVLREIPEVADRSIPALIQSLQDDHPMVRIEAVKSLARLPGATLPAAPALTRLVFDDQQITLFRAGMGIGDTESVRSEALQALNQLKPAPEDIIPTMIRSLHNAQDVPFEALTLLRKVADSAEATRAPLIRLLEKESSRVGAACGLAIVDPQHPGLQSILVDALIIAPTLDDDPGDGEQVNPIAVMGLGELAAGGHSLHVATRQRFIDLSESSPSLFLDSAILKADRNQESVNRLLKSLRDAHGVFEADGIREAEATLRRFASEPPVRNALVRALNYKATKEDREDEFFRQWLQSSARLQAAAILVEAEVAQEKAVECLTELLDDNHGREMAVEVLARCGDLAERAIPKLTELLAADDLYIIGGDFYGNGGERRILGDRAALALVALNAREALYAALDSPNPQVRMRVLRALSGFGPNAVNDRVLRHAEDESFLVRRELMRILGTAFPQDRAAAARARLILQQASQNATRRSVREEATRSLKQLEHSGR